MRTIIFILTIILSTSLYTQTENPVKSIFLRVYDINGKKIAKGRVLSINDSIIHLNRGKKSFKISMSNIGKIKTKRSAGHNILVPAAVGATTLGAIMAKPIDGDNNWFGGDGYSASEGALGGVIMGGTTGAILGAITIPFKFSKTYLINGDYEKWQAFKAYITK
ncbi:MAG: hypothetical protein HKO92_09540 [Flavobacteriaceae bacterium]|nr:hypothetical protein [Flavobacteriaceae bacterium]